jgi:hypothetical protein
MVNAPGAPPTAHGEKLKRYIQLAGATKIRTPGACGAPKNNPPGPSTFGPRGRDTGSQSLAAPAIKAEMAWPPLKSGPDKSSGPHLKHLDLRRHVLAAPTRVGRDPSQSCGKDRGAGPRNPRDESE